MVPTPVPNSHGFFRMHHRTATSCLHVHPFHPLNSHEFTARAFIIPEQARVGCRDYTRNRLGL